MLRGKFKGKSLIRITVQDDQHLRFEGAEGPTPEKKDDVVVHTSTESGTAPA
jgi:hypothetical protein